MGQSQFDTGSRQTPSHLGLNVLKPCSWWRTQFRDLLELFALPGIAALLPWRASFALYKQVAKAPGLYKSSIDAAAPWVKQSFPELDDKLWRYQRRLMNLVDHADWVLSKTRSEHWIQKHVKAEGQWPDGHTPQLICTFHWGAGMWTLPAMRKSGLQVNALAASLDPRHFVGRPLLHIYARYRTAQVVKALGRPTIDVSASMRPVLKALQRQESLLGVIDVPSDNFESSMQVDLFGHKAYVPLGLLRLAVEKQLPVTLFMAGLNLETGQRQWMIHNLGIFEDLQVLTSTAFLYLEQGITATPSAWHLWSEMPRFIQKQQD